MDLPTRLNALEALFATMRYINWHLHLRSAGWPMSSAGRKPIVARDSYQDAHTTMGQRTDKVQISWPKLFLFWLRECKIYRLQLHSVFCVKIWHGGWTLIADVVSSTLATIWAPYAADCPAPVTIGKLVTPIASLAPTPHSPEKLLPAPTLLPPGHSRNWNSNKLSYFH